MAKVIKDITSIACCTRDVLTLFMPFNERYTLHHKIRQECLEKYNEDRITECTKRMICLKKSCMGRPLPNTPTAMPYLKELEKVADIRVNKDTGEKELFIGSCNSCRHKSSCKSACYMINDYLSREKTKEIPLEFKFSIDNILVEKQDLEPSGFSMDDSNIAWDAINERKRQIIKKYLYERKDFCQIAKELNMLNQSSVKYAMYSAINKLSEFGVVREFLKQRGQELTKKQRMIFEAHYLNGLEKLQIAKLLGITKQAVAQILKRVIDKYGIKWKTYVKRNKKGVAIFSVPMILK